MKRNVCVVITARPSYSRIKTALAAVKEHPDLNLQLIVAASALLNRYGQTVNYIESDGFEISRKVHMVIEGENLLSMAKTTGLGVIELSTTFDNLKPDIVITIADRYETIATAIAASYMNIPVAHIQGGEVSGSIDEKVRHAVTKLSDFHFVATEKARENVERMGEDPDCIFNTGCPSIDLAVDCHPGKELDYDVYDKYEGVGAKVDISKGYIVVLQHPVTTEYRHAVIHARETLIAMQKIDYPILWFWPNVDAGSDGTSNAIRTFREEEDARNFHFFKNFTSFDFLLLLQNSICLVGNSSAGIRECSFLGVPVVNIGSRQSGRERSENVIDVDYSSNDILSAVKAQIKNGHYPRNYLYGKGDAGKRIAEFLSKIELRIEKKLTY